MTVLVVYPDAGTGGTTVDGNAARTSVNETFSTIRSSAGTTSADTDTIMSVGLVGSTTSNQFAQLYRYLATLDTSSIGTGQVISEAIFSVTPWTVATKENGLGETSLSISSSTPASDNAIVNADYSQVGRTEFGNIAYGDYTSGSYNDITLNSSGISNIDMEGISKFSLQVGWDVSGTFDGTWASNGSTKFYLLSADQAGTTSDPKLTITYAPEAVPPTVTTQAVSGFDHDSAFLNGTITDVGVGNCTTRGFYWKEGTTGDPTASDNIIDEDGDFEAGAYSIEVTGLEEETSYRIAAFATNADGTSVGSTVGFTTEEKPTMNGSGGISSLNLGIGKL